MPYVTKTQLAAKMGCSERTIDRWLAQGIDLGRAQVGGKIFFDGVKAEAALKGRPVEADDETPPRVEGVHCARLSG
jgi:hypothetical protein